MIENNIHLHVQIDDVISQAQATKGVLSSQRTLFVDIQGKVKQLSDKFPVIRGLLGLCHLSVPIFINFVETKFRFWTDKILIIPVL